MRRAALENEASSEMPVGDFVDMFWPHVFPQRESSLKNNTKIVSCHHMMKHFDPAGSGLFHDNDSKRLNGLKLM